MIIKVIFFEFRVIKTIFALGASLNTMQRPRQHIIETESKKHLTSIIPNHWVLRELAPDYGLDFMVEIFNGENSTGSIFYLQLKGSDQKIENNVTSYQLKREHIEYYNSIPSPVLFVIYSTRTNQFWGLWTNLLKDVLIEDDTEQKTFKLNLDKGHLIDKSFFIELESSFNIDLPKKVNVSVISTTDKGQLYHQQLVKWIQYYYGEHIELENSLLPSTIKFQYTEETENFLSVLVVGSKKIFTLNPLDITDDTFLYLPLIDINHSPTQFKEALILISFLLHKYNIGNSIELLIKNITDDKAQFFYPIFIIEMIKQAIKSNSVVEVESLSKTIIEKNRIDLLQFINFSILTFDKESKFTNLYRTNLIDAIENVKDRSLIGTLSYNLANSYRSKHQLYLASKYYQKARKNENDYLNRSYWWSEYAGVLFLSSHYACAEKFYKKSHNLNSEEKFPLIHSLIGDTLFFQGKFSDAKIEFEKFINVDSNFPREEIFLKIIVCQNFVSAELHNTTFEIAKSTELAEQAFADKNLEKLAEAIQAYPLNGLAWFNYGVFLNKKDHFESAFMAFLTTACIQDWDKEAWKNCLLIAFNLQKKEDFILIYYAMLEKFGVESVNYISEHLLKDPNLDKEGTLKVIEIFSSLAKTKQERDAKKAST